LGRELSVTQKLNDSSQLATVIAANLCFLEWVGHSEAVLLLTHLMRYGKMPYQPGESLMTAAARFDLKLDADDKDLLARAASLMGTTMAGFVRKICWSKSRACCCLSATLLLLTPPSAVPLHPTRHCRKH
jgi:hypothetical protein